MKKSYFFLLLSLIFFSGFSPKPISDPSFSADEAMENSYKTKIVKDVFNRLKMAKGDFRSRRPYLRFVETNDNGPASAYAKIGLIIMEEKAYDICQEFGKDSLNALAVFLAHELIHCYEKHDWEAHFASQFKDGMDLHKITDNEKEDEVQADYLGGFLAYQAGFKTFGIMPDFLDKVYTAYGLRDENMENYPPKAERRAMSEKSAEKLKELTSIFEAGNFLTAIGDYQGGLDYYLMVLEDFQSREVYNNAGVVSVLSALDDFSDEELKNLDFPIELDMKTRAGTRDFNKEEREEKLLKAIDLFAKARQLDAFYPPAYLNEGCARAILGIAQKDFSDLEWEDAKGLARRAIRLAKNDAGFSSTPVDAKVLLGILKVLEGKEKEGDALFKEALSENPENIFAKNNLARSSDLGTKKTIEDNEVIDDLLFKDIKLGKTDIKDTIRFDHENLVRLAVKRSPNSLILANVASRGIGGQKVNSITLFHLTDPSYSGLSGKGVKIGDSISTVLEKYGQPDASISLGSGVFLRYLLPEKRGLVFQIDGDNKVRRWGIFKN